MTQYKRKYRELDDDVKKKISASTKGRRKSFWHRQHIQQGMLDYWKTVEHRPENNSDNTDEQC